MVTLWRGDPWKPSLKVDWNCGISIMSFPDYSGRYIQSYLFSLALSKLQGTKRQITENVFRKVDVGYQTRLSIKGPTDGLFRGLEQKFLFFNYHII
jgi:hypothetical protein